MKFYNYKGYSPYGAGEMYFLDGYVESDFCGNVTEEIVKNGAEFKIIDAENAKLTYKGDNVDFVKR